MQFSGISAVYLPQVLEFSFLIDRIKVPNTNNLNFVFSDAGSNSFVFNFSGGYITTDKIISLYNTNEEVSISGFYSSGAWTYKIGDIYNKKVATFSKLNTLTVSGGANYTNCDIFINAKPITYSVAFAPSYNIGSNLTGRIVSNTKFLLNSNSLFSYNSNSSLLRNTISSGYINVGNNIVTLNDIDPDWNEYSNNFKISLNTPFGDMGGKFTSQRTGLVNRNILSFADYDSNVYFKETPFGGYWSGRFVYVDVPTTYSFNYSIQNMNYIGDGLTSLLSLKFEPIYPINKLSYVSSYVTGFSLTNSGLYSGLPPTFCSSGYYYTTGINRVLESFLFSTGCSETMNISFSGANSGQASGVLTLKDVYLQDIYGVGINKFKAIFDYSALNSGSGYRNVPTIIYSTGGGCYSIPDYSGVESGQFKKARLASGALLPHSYGLTGVVLTSGITGLGGVVTGYKVTGVDITNIGYGYNSGYPANLSFLRWTGDSLNNNASGIVSLKSTGYYDFTGIWNISHNYNSDNYQSLNAYNGYYSGDVSMSESKNNINFIIGCSGMDNTDLLSGRLSFNVSGGNKSITGEKIIFLSRTYNSDTGALYSSTGWTSVSPQSDMSWLYEEDQLDSIYLGDLGSYNSEFIF